MTQEAPAPGNNAVAAPGAARNAEVPGMNLKSQGIIVGGVLLVIFGGAIAFVFKLKSEIKKQISEVEESAKKTSKTLGEVEKTTRSLGEGYEKAQTALSNHATAINEHTSRLERADNTLQRYSKAASKSHTSVKNVVQKLVERANGSDNSDVQISSRGMCDPPVMKGLGGMAKEKSVNRRKKVEESESESEGDSSSADSDSDGEVERGAKRGRASAKRGRASGKRAQRARVASSSDEDSSDESSSSEEETRARSKKSSIKKK